MAGVDLGSSSLSCNACRWHINVAGSLTTLHHKGLAAKSLAAPHFAPRDKVLGPSAHSLRHKKTASNGGFDKWRE